MSDTVIKVENLSKRYVIGHQRQERYCTLRDTIANGTKSLKQRFFNPSQKLDDPAHEEFWALKDVSFEIKQGDRVGIIGRNGAGKSTLLKILSRITEPTSGKISIKGRVASLLEVGTGFHPELTGRENIFLNGAILGMSRAEINKKFDEIVDFAEVEKFLDTPVKHYSSGMYVRLAFAVAAHLEPEILIVDEVLAVGDAAFQKKCLGKMEDVAEKEGRTVLFVSHNMTAIKKLCPRVVLLQNGSLKADGLCHLITSEYLRSSNSNSFAREWDNEADAPQNLSIVIKKIYIGDTHNYQILNYIDTDTDFCFVIEFKVKKEKSYVGLTAIVYTDEEDCVFSSINNTDAKSYNHLVKSGIYKSTCTIPSNFLNNGIFLLSINIFGTNFSDSHMIQNVLKFEVLDGSALRGNYYGDYDGVVRPKLQWSTTINH